MLARSLSCLCHVFVFSLHIVRLSKPVVRDPARTYTCDCITVRDTRTAIRRHSIDLIRVLPRSFSGQCLQGCLSKMLAGLRCPTASRCFSNRGYSCVGKKARAFFNWFCSCCRIATEEAANSNNHVACEVKSCLLYTSDAADDTP